MSLEIQRKKDGTLRSKWWYGRFAVNGKSSVVNLGVEIKGAVPGSLKIRGDNAYEHSRMKAYVKLEDLIAEANSRKAAEHHLEKLYELKAGADLKEVPVAEIAARWIALPARRKRTTSWEKTQCARFKLFSSYIQTYYPAAKYISQVTPKMAREWLHSVEDHYAPATYNELRNLLKGFFERVGHEAGVIRNPFLGCATKIKKTIHRQPFTQKELTAILKHCDKVSRPVVLTAMCTAMRRGDCCRLKWESVDLQGGFITVKTSKTGEVAEIPLFPLLRAELERLPRTSEYVFPEAEEMYRTNIHGLTWRFQQALKNAEIEDTQLKRNDTGRQASVKDFHSLRTTWITMALSAGVPMELVRRVTGHSTVDVVLKHYFRPGKEAFKTALETAMPKMLTGGDPEDQKSKDENQNPKDALLELVEQAAEVSKEAFVAKVAKIAHGMAA